ncbi:MAG: 50S ribosomal protein L10 [Minisyncoccia bacterium]
MISKQKKQEIVQELLEAISKAKAIYFTSFMGLDVSKISDLRNKLRESNTKAKVAKKTLADLSFKQSGIEINLKEQFDDSIMFDFAFDDPILAAKTLWQFSKQNENLKILGAFMDGKILKREEVIQLAQIPPREVLLGRLVSSLASPIRNLNYVLKGNTYKLVYALSALQSAK